jgi:hypothetical protein
MQLKNNFIFKLKIFYNAKNYVEKVAFLFSKGFRVSNQDYLVSSIKFPQEQEKELSILPLLNSKTEDATINTNH